MRVFSAFIFCLLFMCESVSAQSFYDINTIQKIELTFSQPNWDYQLDTAKQGADTYILATQVKINGVTFDSVGVKYKGNSSYSPTSKKNPLHIEIDHYKNQSYNGIKDIKLGNNYKDPSMIREVLGYDILKNYMHCSQSNFAKVYINGVYYGVYSNTENIDKQFYSNHYYSSGNTAIKCNPIVNPSTNTKCNLKYINNDSSSYFNFYELKSNYGWNQFVALCDTVTNYQNRVSDNIDIDRVIWMLAFNNVMVNLDSYSGAFCQNYYLYKDNTNHYNPTIWDLNMCFGGFPYLGSGTGSMAQLSITNLNTLPINIHSTDVNWPLINIVNNNAQYKRMLVAHMRTITEEFLASNNYLTKAQLFQSIIDTSIVNDTCKSFTYSQFQNGLTQNISVGSYSVPGISNLLNARLSYLQGTTDFGYATPTITNVVSSSISPTLNSTVTINTSVTNATSVYLGYRNDVTKKFERTLMYDDGLHNDGASGDAIFGTDLTITATSMQYYIYAENNNAGMFSPQRAEHEYYTLTTNISQPTSGQVVINEFLAVNQSGQLDENNQYEDWIELYNTTNTALDLSGLYLSDNNTNLQKFTFPSNSIIPANGYLTVWADEDNGDGSSIHCNFKLSASGEQIFLTKGTTILDSVTFGSQNADISVGRCPNGTGSFSVFTVPTYNSSNCAVGLNELTNRINLVLYPNPVNQFITIESDIEKETTLTITNSVGEIIIQKPFKQSEKINTSAFSQGIYFVKLENSVVKFIVLH